MKNKPKNKSLKLRFKTYTTIDIVENGSTTNLEKVIKTVKIGFLIAWNKALVIKKTG